MAPLSSTIAATAICPILWATPPAILTPVMPNRSKCRLRIMTRRLSAAPARPYIIMDMLPKVNPVRITRTRETAAAACHPRV